MKELLMKIISALRDMPEFSEGEGDAKVEVEIESGDENPMMESENEMPEEDDGLMEHMKSALIRPSQGGVDKPMFGGGSMNKPPMKKPEMPMQKRFGK